MRFYYSIATFDCKLKDYTKSIREFKIWLLLLYSRFNSKPAKLHLVSNITTVQIKVYVYVLYNKSVVIS